MRVGRFSEFYSYWLGEAGSYDEKLETCEPCQMLHRGYLADLKCCTYFPYLPNFTIGALLTSSDPKTQTHLEIALKTGRINPLGIFASKEHLARKTQAGEAGFGQLKELLCPFFSNASRSCSIWKFRPGVCSSYFCQSSRATFWSKIEADLNQFEWTLAHEVLWRMGFTKDETNRMEQEDRWFEYLNHEEDLFRKSYEIALKITPGEVLELMGKPMLHP